MGKFEHLWQQYAIPQFCFMREIQSADSDGTIAVAVPVSRAFLRQTQPYADAVYMNVGLTDIRDNWYPMEY
jgi:hypothetical protein